MYQQVAPINIYVKTTDKKQTKQKQQPYLHCSGDGDGRNISSSSSSIRRCSSTTKLP